MRFASVIILAFILLIASFNCAVSIAEEAAEEAISPEHAVNITDLYIDKATDEVNGVRILLPKQYTIIWEANGDVDRYVVSLKDGNGNVLFRSEDAVETYLILNAQSLSPSTTYILSVRPLAGESGERDIMFRLADRTDNDITEESTEDTAETGFAPAEVNENLDAGKIPSEDPALSEQNGAVQDSSADDTAQDDKCGDDLIWTLSGSTLIISGSGDMWDFDDDNPGWGMSEFETVTIESGVKSIGNWAFYDHDSLKSVTIADTVTRIGEWAFYDCGRLTDLMIPESVKNIGDFAFDSCSELAAIFVTNGSYAQEYCMENELAYKTDGIAGVSFDVSTDISNHGSISEPAVDPQNEEQKSLSDPEIRETTDVSSESWICSNCGKESVGKFCGWCGTKRITEVICPSCGAAFDASAGYMFCGECGTALGS